MFEGPLPPDLFDPDERPSLADVDITYDVEIEDTGEVAQVTENAAQALEAAEKRLATLQQLAECLG